jgi:hypothetical protein
MVNVDQTQPADVVDRLLWQDAQTMLGRHAEPDLGGDCVWCGWRWPCAPRRVAERAATASRRPWREAWTLRHDMNSIRAIPSMRTGSQDPGLEGPGGEREAGPVGGNRRVRRAGVNRGAFD